MKFTVIGSRGFVGSHLCAFLESHGHEVARPSRAEGEGPGEAGHVIDCGGLTADFRTRRDEIFEAHVCRIDRILQAGRFSSYLYLSSTRVYKNAAATSEDEPLEVRPSLFDDSYNISKIAGEAACLLRENPAVRVARLSNVLGLNPDPAVFVTSLVEAARRDGRLALGESLHSSKDYLAIDDVCRYLRLIALEGRHRLYNVAYGENRTHRQVADAIARHVDFTLSAPDHPTRAFPPIDTRRLRAEFGPPQVTPEDAIDQLLRAGLAES